MFTDKDEYGLGEQIYFDGKANVDEQVAQITQKKKSKHLRRSLG